jgi:O-antigen ligase
MFSSIGFFSKGESSPINRIRNSGTVRAVNEYMRSPWYVVLIAVLAALSSVFELDLVLYSAFILIGIFVCLFGFDLLPMMPIVICCYIAPSAVNNPGRNETSIFYPQNGGIYLLVIAVLFVMALLYRLITDSQIGGRKFIGAKRSLAGSMILLGITYLLSGIGIDNYAAYFSKNLLFAIVQFASIFVMYYLFAGAVRWERAPKDYLAWIGMSVGFVVLVQLLENYFSGRIFMEGSGTIDRELISTGWGMHNNVGGLMAMMLPFPFYLAYTKPQGWIYNILGTVLMVGVVISCSRTSMIVAAMAYCVCAVLLIRNKQTRKANLRVYLIAAVVVLVVAVVFFQKLLDVFALFFEELFIVSERDNLFVYGMKQFLSHPIFGGSFFPQGEYKPWEWSKLESFTSFFPPRWHNTLVQIGASCGVVGLAAYLFHRAQTVILLVKQRSTEKLFIGLYLLVLLLASMLDCHFFNIGPVLFYSMALAFAENIGQSKS